MNLDRYEYYASDKFLSFEFYSEGPNGRIKKVIQFVPINLNGYIFYNLGFGDYQIEDGQIDDQSISNNGDRERILATIAQAVMEFMDFYPDKIVHAMGSTPARTRLYQMSINANWKEIKSRVAVLGLKDGVWKPFNSNINYEAFIGKRKKTYLHDEKY